MPAAIVHFEIHASDVLRAKKFYETVFDWRIEQWGDQEYWAVYTGRSEYSEGSGSVGMDGGLLPRKGNPPAENAGANAFLCTVEVENIDYAMHQIEDAGGKIVLGKKPIVGVGWQAFCEDTEGNVFGIMQEDPTAA
jgi:predicted enzyme related to lactoylglutathione lyase